MTALTPPRPRPLGSAIALAALPLLVACPSPVIGEYQAARTAALADPGPVPEGWRPDVVLHLSPALVDSVITAALEAEGHLTRAFDVEGPLGFKAQVTPDLTVDELALRPTRSCASCLAVDAEISGDVAWRSGLGNGSTPVQVALGLDATFAADRDGDLWRVTVTPSDVRRVDVSLGGARGGIPRQLETRLAEQMKQILSQRAEPITVAELGGDVPLRAIQLLPTDRSIRIGMLTGAPGENALPASRVRLTEGWRLDISQASLLAIARAESFRAGPVSRDVVVEPRSLDMRPDGFAMDIRLWRTTGRGWWRDYTVNGTMGLEGKGIHLQGDEVIEGPKSPGAAFADPLAALAEGLILRAIEGSVAASFPSSRRDTTRKLQTELRVTGISTSNGVLSALGELDVERRATTLTRPTGAPRRGPTPQNRSR